MAVYDAQLNNTARNTRQYTDLDLFFENLFSYLIIALFLFFLTSFKILDTTDLSTDFRDLLISRKSISFFL